LHKQRYGIDEELLERRKPVVAGCVCVCVCVCVCERLVKGGELVLLENGRKVLTNMETVLKNSRAYSNAV
jgi:hypothetical protein